MPPKMKFVTEMWHPNSKSIKNIYKLAEKIEEKRSKKSKLFTNICVILKDNQILLSNLAFPSKSLIYFSILFESLS